MKGKYLLLITLILNFLSPPCRSEPSSHTHLTLEQVLTSSKQYYPAILASLARRNATYADQLSAQGAFDTVFSSDGYSRVSGFWDGSVINTNIRKNIAPLGGALYAGYRLSDGAFPIYEDANFTNSGGEAKIGVLFSLLRDRAIDQRRYNVNTTALATQEADFTVLLTQLGVQHKAQGAYWRWVAAGHALQIYEQLLAIAKERQKGLETEVRMGARASIFLTENQQNITRREILVTQARRDFQVATTALSLYYRNDHGETITPDRSVLPALNFGPVDFADDIDVDRASEAVFALRPELKICRLSSKKQIRTWRLDAI